MEDELSFGRWLQRQRRALDLTQAALAKRVGCAAETLRKIEADARRPSRQIAERLAEALELPTADRAAFVRVARAEWRTDRLAPPTQNVLQPAFVPITTIASQHTNLPTPLTPLIGRDHEIAEICMRLRNPDVRLLTLIGPGGIGKTHLALQVVVALLDAFPDGLYFVDLVPIHDPALVTTTIAQTLDVRESEDRSPLDQLKGYLREKQLLLVLDNFEHLLAAAPSVADLLAACPKLKMLVTSRATLKVRGEKEYAVPPLALPEPNQPPLDALSQAAAAQLFIARTMDAQPRFVATVENASAIAAICTRLDGLPLALELAAARMKVFTPQALLARLAHQLILLTGGARDLPARQQTIRATIDWSYHLLTPEEQILFAQLGVFVGGWTLEAAEAIGTGADEDLLQPTRIAALPASIADLLTSLIDKSLVRRDVGANDEPRFTMLETLRAYALERLDQRGEAEALRQRHARYFLALAEAAEPRLRGHEQENWLARLEAEHSNLRTALTWCLEAQDGAQTGLRLAGALSRFWEIRGHRNEARAWLGALLARPEAAQPTVARAKALAEAGNMAPFGEMASYEESLALARALGASAICAQALYNLGYCTYYRGDAVQGVAYLEESLDLYRELGDRWGAAEALRDLAEVEKDRGDLERAMLLLEASLPISQELGDQRSSAETLCDMGRVAHDRGNLVRATTLYEQSLPLAHHLKDKRISARVLRGLAKVARAQGNVARAAMLSEQSLNLARDIGDSGAIADVLCDLAEVELQQGNSTRALALYQEGLSLFRAAEHHLDVAWTLLDLGRTVRGRGDDIAALAHVVASLAMFRKWGYVGGIISCLEALAGIIGTQGQPARAVRLLATAEALRDARGVPLSTADRAEWERNVAVARAQLTNTSFTATWAEGCAMTLEQVVAEALR